MTDDRNDPYRGMEKRAPSELEVLAAKGERLHADRQRGASSDTEREGDRNLSLAIGGHYGTPLKRGLWVATGVVGVGFVAAIVAAATGSASASQLGSVFPFGIPATVLLLVAALLVPPHASKAQRDAEEAWVRARPFPLLGYPAVLRAPPSIYVNLRVTITWAARGSAPDPATLRGVVHLADPSVERIEAHADGASWVSGRIDGDTGVMVNRRIVTRNHRIVGYVHRLSERTLEPIHRNSAIARVEVSRA
jgi:hypothetical protein